MYYVISEDVFKMLPKFKTEKELLAHALDDGSIVVDGSARRVSLSPTLEDIKGDAKKSAKKSKKEAASVPTEGEITQALRTSRWKLAGLAEHLGTTVEALRGPLAKMKREGKAAPVGKGRGAEWTNGETKA
mgnify:CR=1 FL=1